MLRIPINHFEGNYTCSPRRSAELQAEDRVVLRYVDNPNGSVDDIAGVRNEGGNVVGLMPHPERASHALLGSADGRRILAVCSTGSARLSRQVEPRTNDAPRVGSHRAGDAGLLQHGGVDADLPPRGVGDALPGAVALATFDEVGLEGGRSILSLIAVELALEVHALLDQLEALERIGFGKRDLDLARGAS